MPETEHHSLFHMRARGDWVRLRTLVVLRWLAIFGQTSAVVLATQVLDYDLPLPMCALVISASVSFNIAAHIIHPSEKRLSERGTLMSLFFDLAQLVTMLMLTGGLNNPFAVLIIAPVTIAATALRMQSTLALGGVALLSIPLMAVLHMPLTDPQGEELLAPEIFRVGFAASLAIGLIFLALYARRVTVEGYAMSEALSATQLALAREQRLSAIGGIAAATAHELGTPLATIKLVAAELADDLSEHSDWADDAKLIRSEADRCAAILADLRDGARDDNHVKQAPISAVIDEAAQPHKNRGKKLIVRVNGINSDETGDDQPLVARTPELIHGLRNAVQNAVDFAGAYVWIDADLEGESLRVAVGDDGPGFTPDLLPRLGEPYVTSRARGSRTAGAAGYEGMGLGLFIARTLLERTGATVSFANGSDGRRKGQRNGTEYDPLVAHPPGAIIEMVWPIHAMVVSKGESRRALGQNPRI